MSVYQGNFFRPPTLTSHSFAANWAMMMKSSSFESPKSYLYSNKLKNGKAALIKYIIYPFEVPPFYTINCLKVQSFCKPLYQFTKQTKVNWGGIKHPLLVWVMKTRSALWYLDWESRQRKTGCRIHCWRNKGLSNSLLITIFEGQVSICLLYYLDVPAKLLDCCPKMVWH